MNDDGDGSGAKGFIHVHDPRDGEPLVPEHPDARGQVTILFSDLVRDGASSWVVTVHIPAWRARLYLTTGGADESAALAEAEAYVRDHLMMIRADAGRVNAAKARDARN